MVTTRRRKQVNGGQRAMFEFNMVGCSDCQVLNLLKDIGVSEVVLYRLCMRCKKGGGKSVDSR